MADKTVDTCCRALRSSGLRTNEAYPILDEIKKWIKSNGEEWTVKRLKSLKTGYVNYLAYGEFRLPEDSWIAHDEKGPKGPFRALMKLKKPWKALSSFMVYTSFTSKKVTDSQWNKFNDSLGPGVEVPYDIFESVVDEFRKLPIPNHGDWVNLEAYLNKGTRIPIWKPLKDDPYTGYLCSSHISYENVQSTIVHPLIEDWFSDRWNDLPDSLYHLYASAVQKGDDCDGCQVGQIGMIQEPGYKLRVVANPLPGFQIYLSEFGDKLYRGLARLEEDATFDQDKAVSEIQEYMKQGNALVGIDLSNATDRFPAELTFAAIGQHESTNLRDLQLWEDVSRANWQCKQVQHDIKWEHGQPLGVYPSFAGFALTHHALARSVKPDFYRILGDDIVIDKVHAELLIEKYQRLGLKISWDKTLDSPHMTEFAGRLITKDKVLSQPKWRDISDRSFVDLARQIGPNSLGFLKPRQKAVVKLLAEVPSDLHPMGMNWNPNGKPYAQRELESQRVLKALEKPDLDDFRSLTSKALSNLKMCSLANYGVEFSTHFEHYSKVSYHDSQIGSLEDRILSTVGVTHIDAESAPSPFWDRDMNLNSDPRGISTLENLEKKFASEGLMKPKLRKSR